MTRMLEFAREDGIGLLAAMAIAAASTLPATAQITQAQQDAIRASCRSDAMSSCPGMRGAEALRCLQGKVSSLSPGCRGAVSATMPAAAAAPPAPPPAASAPPPPPAAAAPAPAPMAAPSSAPPAAAPPAASAKPAAAPAAATPRAPSPPKPAVAAVPPAAAPMAASPAPPVRLRQANVQELVVVRRRCGTDMEIHCRNVPAGDGRIVACLASHEPALSPGCKGALAPLKN